MSESVNRKCMKCGFVSLNKNDKFCIRCGAVLPKIPVVEPEKPVIKDNQKYCSNCGFTVNDLSEKFCINCGQPIRLSQVQPVSIKNSTKKYCSNCGKEIIDRPDIKFCKSCGKPIVSVGAIKEQEKPHELKKNDESDLEFDESIGEPLIKKESSPPTTLKEKIPISEEKPKIEAFSIPKLEDVLNQREIKPEYQSVPNQGLIPKPSAGPVPSTIPNPVKQLNIIPQTHAAEKKEPKIETTTQPQIPEEPKSIEKPSVEELKAIEVPQKTEQTTPLPESIKEPTLEETHEKVTTPESKAEKEWKKVKIAVCPKCERHCRVAGAEFIEKDEWTPLMEAKKIENGKYLVECPGCGVFFIADINMAIPCFEERY